MSPDAYWGTVALIAAILYAIWFVRDAARRRRETRERPTPWYAHQSGGPGQRWTPEAWRDAADLSIQNSQRRRHGNPPGHPADYHG
jgi:hypothetical protein